MTPFVEEAIRPHVTGRFAVLLAAVITHPMMLAYLDQTDSMGPNSQAALRRDRGLNENLARELLELHAVGAVSSTHLEVYKRQILTCAARTCSAR